MEYDKTKSLGANAIKGVDITEPGLPSTVEITEDLEFDLPEAVWDAIWEHLTMKYGKGEHHPEAYGLKIVVEDITWEANN